MGADIRVLHVDDEPGFAELTVEYLEQERDGFRVVAETTAPGGLDRLAASEVDCIVSDYQMPGMDGLAFLEVVREDHPDLPFILFTGRGSEEVASEAISAGATDYLQKGGADQYAILANRIENAVESARARERVVELERVRTTVRDINQALVRATSREEIETRVCEIIGRLADVRLVVISGVDAETNRVEPRTWAGEAAGFLDAVELTVETTDAGAGEPHARAYAEREVAGSSDVQSDPAFERWRDAAVEHGLRALVVVPLAYEDERFGLLSLYGTEPQPVDDERRALLAEVGDDIGHALDATVTRRALEASETRFRALTSAASDAILTIDETSTITFANPAVERLFGYRPDELRGSSLTRLMPEQLRDPHREGIGRYLRTGERQLDWTGVELTGRQRDGTEVPLSVSFGEFEQDGERFFTGVVRDVTERTEQAAALRRQNKYLEEFAGVVAHDLRNPLSVARGRVELARTEREGEHLTVVAETLDRMDRLIDDLLLLARQGRDIEDVAPVSLADVAETVRQAVDADAVTLDLDRRLGTIVAHRGRVRALLKNLFRNAVEHGDGPVTVRVLPLEDGFAVEDDGPGVPAADRDEVFEPGFTTKADGTGFGLTIVGQVADAHGWDVAVTEGTDGGARFEFTGVELDA